MKLILPLLIFTAFIPTANAELETDRIAGNCAALLTALNKPNMAAQAIQSSDNQTRATNFALAWIRDVKRYEGRDILIQGMVNTATGDCRKIGIRSSD